MSCTSWMLPRIRASDLRQCVERQCVERQPAFGTHTLLPLSPTSPQHSGYLLEALNMPKVKTSRTKEPPEGFDEIEEVVRQLRGGGCQNMAEAGSNEADILVPFNLFSYVSLCSCHGPAVPPYPPCRTIHSDSSKNTNAKCAMPRPRRTKGNVVLNLPGPSCGYHILGRGGYTNYTTSEKQ